MSTVEVHVGIICACLPAIRSLFSVVFPGTFGPSRNGTANNRRITDDMVVQSPGNRINIRQEWTVLSDPFPREHRRQHGGRGSDSDVELVGIGTALSMDVVHGGPDHKTRHDPGTAVGMGFS